MALNKLKLGTALSTQVAEQNDNWTVLDGLVNGVSIDFAGEISSDLTLFAENCTNNTKFFTAAKTNTGLPEGISGYGMGFVFGRLKGTAGSNYRWIIFIDIQGRVATRGTTGAEWSAWRVYDGVIS